MHRTGCTGVQCLPLKNGIQRLKCAVMMRFITIKGLPDLQHKFGIRYNQYESLVKPLLAFLNDHGVDFNMKRKSILEVEVTPDKSSEKDLLTRSGKAEEIDLTE